MEWEVMGDELYIFPQSIRAGSVSKTSGGATLRDVFAAIALLRMPPIDFSNGEAERQVSAMTKVSYAIADAMLEARDEK